MNAKQLLAALAIVTAGGAAMAVEATQFDATPSTKTRDEVRAEMVQARLDGTLMRGGEATVFVDRPVAAGARSEPVACVPARSRSISARTMAVKAPTATPAHAQLPLVSVIGHRRSPDAPDSIALASAATDPAQVQ